MPDEQLTTRQAAEALRVSESSVKRWCDRGAIPTVRTIGGHRRIPLDGFLQFLEESKLQIVNPIGGLKQKALSDNGLKSADEFQTAFSEALVNGDEERCRGLLLQWYHEFDSFPLLADNVIAATFARLGELWACGDLEIYQERRGCEICSRLIYELQRLLPEPSPTAPLALGGGPSGDLYTLPCQLIESVLKDCGWRSMNLGSNLPLRTIANAAVKHQPRVVWLSVSHIDDEDSFLDDYANFYTALPIETCVVLGGRALDDRLRPKLKYTAHCDNMQQMAEFARAVHGRRRPIESSAN